MISHDEKIGHKIDPYVRFVVHVFLEYCERSEINDQDKRAMDPIDLLVTYNIRLREKGGKQTPAMGDDFFDGRSESCR